MNLNNGFINKNSMKGEDETDEESHALNHRELISQLILRTCLSIKLHAKTYKTIYLTPNITTNEQRK